MTSRDPFLQVRGACVSFGEVVALDHLDIEVMAGETMAILGPSGCGKSTLLRVISGLQGLSSGDVLLDGVDLSSIATYKRGIGLMFQDHALFPHLDVAANIAFGLRMKRVAKVVRDERVAEMLDLVGLESKAKRAITELSGGERQRVALARTLAPAPKLVLLDEPLGSLDRALRERLASDMVEIFSKLGTTAIFVTHDHGEASDVGHLVAIMRSGRVLQIATSEELWASPIDQWTADFIGPPKFQQKDW